MTVLCVFRLILSVRRGQRSRRLTSDRVVSEFVELQGHVDGDGRLGLNAHEAPHEAAFALHE